MFLYNFLAPQPSNTQTTTVSCNSGATIGFLIATLLVAIVIIVLVKCGKYDKKQESPTQKIETNVHKEKKDTFFCQNCGKELSKDSVFCNFCGTKQTNIELNPPDKKE